MTKNTINAAQSCSDSTDKNDEQRALEEQSPTTPAHVAQDAVAPNDDLPATPAKESGGQAGLDPTRYGDWEKKGRCTDF